jgi:hypothetical protein
MPDHPRDARDARARRRRGYPQQDAEDFTQAFFIKLPADESLAAGWARCSRPRSFSLNRPVATHISITVAPSGNKFYRLRKP